MKTMFGKLLADKVTFILKEDSDFSIPHSKEEIQDMLKENLTVDGLIKENKMGIMKVDGKDYYYI
jgi:hypothetical protein